jgi:DNA-binding winged helix-turn-helix (wHTH) protein
VSRRGILTFGAFRLDCSDGRLWLGDTERPLRPKSFALLRYLTEHPGRLVTREELLRAVWPNVAVGPGVVRTSIAEIRRVLGDDVRTPQLLETVGRRGYRFLGRTAEQPVTATSFVGRTDDLAWLHAQLEQCRDLRRRAVFLAAEAGIGKTTLVERFLDEVREAGLGRAASAQCIELHVPMEPYLPVLELLGRLCHEDGGGDVIAALDRWAPTWLLRMPGLVRDADVDRLRRRVPSPTPGRMLRELSDALDALAGDRPLVVVLEDLHWSDASTLDLVTYLAARGTPARLLAIGTYRGSELAMRAYPMRRVVQQLVARGRVAERALEPLAADEAVRARASSDRLTSTG